MNGMMPSADPFLGQPGSPPNSLGWPFIKGKLGLTSLARDYALLNMLIRGWKMPRQPLGQAKV